MRKLVFVFLLACAGILHLSAQGSSRFESDDYWYRIVQDTSSGIPGKVLLSWANSPGVNDGQHTQSPTYPNLYKVVVLDTVSRTELDNPNSPAKYEVIGIEAGAFFACSEMDSVLLPAGKKLSIGNDAFHDCKKLKEVISYNRYNANGEATADTVKYTGFSSSIKSIGVFAFAGCGFTKLDLVADTAKNRTSLLDTIWGGTFSNCVDLDSVIIGNQIKNIRSEAFANCKGLKFVRFDQGKDFPEGSLLYLDLSAFTKSDSIIRIHVRRKVAPVLQPVQPDSQKDSLKHIFQGLNDTCIVYVPFNFMNQYKTSTSTWGQWKNIKPSYAVAITQKKDSLYPQRIDSVRYALIYCKDTLHFDREQNVKWSSSSPAAASVVTKAVPAEDPTDYVAEITTHRTADNVLIKGAFKEESTQGEGAAPDSFFLTVKNVIEVAIKRNPKEGSSSSYIRNRDTIFIHVNNRDTLKTFLHFYGTPNAEQVKNLLLTWKESHTLTPPDGTLYIARTVSDDTSFISPVGHDTATYTVKVQNPEYSADSLIFTVIAPRIEVKIASTTDRNNDGKDTLDVYRATFLSVADTSRFTVNGSESKKAPYPFVWKIIENQTDGDGRPVADTCTAPSGTTYQGRLRVRARRPGTFKIIAITATKDSVPSDTFTLVVKDPSLAVKITAADRYKAHLQNEVLTDRDTLTVPMNHIDTVYPIVNFFNKDVKTITSLAGIADAYGSDAAYQEWLDWDNKGAEYVSELTRLDSLITWKMKYDEDSLLRCSRYNKTDSILLKALRHKGGEAELIATYSFLKKDYHDTIDVIVPPIQVAIYDREGDGRNWGNPLPDKEIPKKAFLNRKDTIGVYVPHIGAPASNAPKGSPHFSIWGNSLNIDSVYWTSLSPAALVNDSGIVTFIDTGKVQICVTTLWKSGDNYIKGVSDTVGFNVSPPVMNLSWKRTTRLPVGNGKTSTTPDTIRLGKSDTVRVTLTCDGLVVDSLSSQLKTFVLDSTIAAIANHVVNDAVKPDTFRIDALAHTDAGAGKKTKIWLNDSLTINGKNYAVSSDSFWVCVPRIYVKATKLSKPQLGRQYKLGVTITHDQDGENPVTPQPDSLWQALEPVTAEIVGKDRDSVRFLSIGTAATPVRVVTSYHATVGGKDSLVYGVADTLKGINVIKPKLTVKISEVSGRQAIAPQMTLKATVKWTDSGTETDFFSLRWISRNQQVFTVNEGNGQVTFVSSSVNGGEAYVVVETFHTSDPATVFAKDSLKITIEAPVVRAYLDRTPVVKLNRSAGFQISVTKDGAPFDGDYQSLSYTVQGEGEKTVEPCGWDPDTRTLCVKGIALGTSKLEARIEGATIAQFTFNVPEPVVRVEKSLPLGVVFLDLHGGSSALQATVFSDDMEVAKPDSLSLAWSVSSSPSPVIQCTQSQNNNREMFIQALAVGEVTVTATIAGKQVAWNVVVVAPTIAIKIPNRANGLDVKVDAETLLPDIEVWENGAITNDYTITWESRDPNILEVNGKKIKGKKVGYTWAVVTATVSGIKKLDSIKVCIPEPDVEISLSSAGTVHLNRGAVQQLPVTIKVDGVSKEFPVRWTSSNTNIITVSSNGLLTATSTPGTAVETVTLSATLDSRWGEGDGGPWQATAGVDVLPSVVEVTPVSLSLHIGANKPLDGFSVTVDGVAPVGLSGWTSGNTAVVTVNENGALTAVGVGRADISVPVLGAPYVVAHVTVEDNAVVIVSLPVKLDTIPVHGTALLQAKVTSNNVEVDTIPVTFEVLTPDLAGIKSSTPTSVLLLGKSSGQVHVRATVRGGTIVSNECVLVVSKPAVTVTAASHVLEARASLSPAVKVEYSPDSIQTNMQLANVRWSVSDTSILSVDTLTGFVQARRMGTAGLTARVPEGGVSLPFDITVLPPATSIRVQGTGQAVDNLIIRMSQTISLEAAVVYHGVMDLTVSKVWLASDPNVVTMDEFFGILVGKLPGLTEVRVLTYDGGKDTVKVQVLPPSITLTASPAKTTIGTGPKDTLLLTALVGYDADNRTPEVPVIWSVTPEGIVTVNGGKVTPLQAGTAVVQATTPATYGGASVGYTVIVDARASALHLPSAEDFSARIKSDGLYLTGLAPQDRVEVYSPHGRILLQEHAGDGFIPHVFSCGAYIVRAAGGVCKVLFTP
ncbi:MAG: leucine-rich repeat protein [Tannerellaceae bacterium]|nr:leucine-rich repeat protein [Tannerellaceae bacterium]